MKKFFLSALTFLIFVILIFALIFGYLFWGYKKWEKTFEGNIKTEFLIDSESIKSIDIDKRVVDFSLSPEDVQSLELDVKEAGSILFTTLDSYVGDEVNIERMYIQPSDSKWILYLKARYEKISLWISIDLNKDNIQSAQLYITEIYVGPFKISEFFDWVDPVNRGIGESIVTLNENGLVGRYIENIELKKDSIILKGSRY